MLPPPPSPPDDRGTEVLPEPPDPRFQPAFQPDPEGLAGKEPARRLSSISTPLHKFGAPAIWSIGFLLAAVLSLTEPAPGGGASDIPPWSFVLPFAGGLAYLWWGFVRLKAVSLRGEVLVIDNFRRQEEVPLSAVERVSGSIFVAPELVWIHFREPTGFGRKVIFTPHWRFFRGWGVHPVVGELERRVEEAKLARQADESPFVPLTERGTREGRY